MLCSPVQEKPFTRKPMTCTISRSAAEWSSLPRSQGNPPHVSSPSVSTTMRPGFSLKLRHVGRLLHGRCQRRPAGRHQGINFAHDPVRSVLRRLEIEADGALVVGPRTTLSMRLTVVGLSLPYPHPLPDIEPDASNTSIASSVQGGRSGPSTRA